MATKVYIVYYSTYGHVEKLAHEIKKGADSLEGVEAKLWQVPETLHEEILGKMGAPPKSDVPVITPDELIEADALIFGFPTRFGMMAAQFKAFLDSTGGLWGAQKLAGKPAGIFYSTGSQGGGQETTALTAITQLAHHGLVFVPIGYTAGAGMFEMEQVKGGSPYGAGTFAGDGTRQPTQLELEIAFHQDQINVKIKIYWAWRYILKMQFGPKGATDPEIQARAQENAFWGSRSTDPYPSINRRYQNVAAFISWPTINESLSI